MPETYPEPLPWPMGPTTEADVIAAIDSRRFGAAGPVSDREVFRVALFGCGGGFDGVCRWTWRHGVTPERFMWLAGLIQVGAIGIVGTAGIVLWVVIGLAIGR